MKRNFLTICVVILLTFCGLAGCGTQDNGGTKEEPDDSTIHMYLIAGQSNAVGISPIATKTAELDLSQTFENIWYAGETDKHIPTSSYGILNKKPANLNANAFSFDFVNVKAGLGRGADNIGPEYGMAEVLNSRYEDSRKAMFFKFATGGTCLRDYNDVTQGNWYPRSQWPESFTPNNTVATGRLYQGFLDDFKIVYERLVEEGHTVRIKGFVWMQGESDRETEEWREGYRVLLPKFIRDMREDIGAITGTDYSKLPFVAGEISDTQFSAEEEYVIRNKAFNTMLHQIITDGTINDYYVIKAGDLPQNEMVNGVSKTLNKVNTGDPWHWIAEHEVTLGNRFGDKLVEVCF